MRNLLIWDSKLGFYDAVSVSDFSEFVETRFDKGTSFYVRRGRVYLEFVNEEQIKAFGKVIEVGYVLDAEVHQSVAWELIHNETIYRRG